MSRRHHVIVTRTGVVIGGAYIPPMRKLGSDEERIQRALLTRPSPRLRSKPCALLAALATALAAIASAIST